MANSGKDRTCLDSPMPSSSIPEDYAMPDVSNTRRLRDRELLRKRKAEAQKKSSAQWVQREQRKRARRGRGGRQGWSCQPVVELILEVDPDLGPQPNAGNEAQPGPSKPESPETVCQKKPPVLRNPEPVSRMQPGAAEGELADENQDTKGEEKALKPAEAEILEALNTCLEDTPQEKEKSTQLS
ncbi:hemogen [Opisthocomus hoazin]|uniref:hemogen n=1 Tax=Opisthocomus hoazin TaxID=30419 RepID=UPI003F53AB83